MQIAAPVQGEVLNECEAEGLSSVRCAAGTSMFAQRIIHAFTQFMVKPIYDEVNSFIILKLI